MKFPLQLQKINANNFSIELFVPEINAVKQAYQKGDISFPYWSQVWPAAIALSEFIENHPYYLQQKNVVELGAGLGLPSIVAAKYAASVLCTDNIEEAIKVVESTAVHHQLKNLQTAIVDWRSLPQDIKADVLLLSDVNYEPSVFEELTKLVKQFLQEKTTIIISTPQRLMAKEFVAPLMKYCIQQEEKGVLHHSKATLISIMVLKQ